MLARFPGATIWTANQTVTPRPDGTSFVGNTSEETDPAASDEGAKAARRATPGQGGLTRTQRRTRAAPSYTRSRPESRHSEATTQTGRCTSGATLGYRGSPRPNRRPPPSSLRSSAIWAFPRQPRTTTNTRPAQSHLARLDRLSGLVAVDAARYDRGDHWTRAAVLILTMDCDAQRDVSAGRGHQLP